MAFVSFSSTMMADGWPAGEKGGAARYTGGGTRSRIALESRAARVNVHQIRSYDNVTANIPATRLARGIDDKHLPSRIRKSCTTIFGSTIGHEKREKFSLGLQRWNDSARINWPRWIKVIRDRGATFDEISNDQ